MVVVVILLFSIIKDIILVFFFEIFAGGNKESRSATSRVYVPTDFDTIEKAFSGAKAAEKGLK